MLSISVQQNLPIKAEPERGLGTHGDIEIVWPEKGGKLGLKKQRPRVKEVLRDSIGELLASLCLKNAYPDGMDIHHNYAKQALIKSADHLGYTDIAHRLRSDKEYVKALASIPAQRVSSFRGNVKRITDPLAPNAFGLKSGDSDYVEWLKEMLRYIYPVDYAKERCQGDKPFGAPVFVQALRNAFFHSSRSIGNLLTIHFESSDPERPEEKEIPAPMLALVSTALYASISDYEFDVFEAAEFSGDSFADVYGENIRLLDKIKSSSLKKYHTLTHRLFREIRGTPSRRVGKSSHGSDTLALLDIDGMDED
ncbi:hypothetical protein GY45DRAFT_1300919 [Cubamyces sp. BRFM 1775]|nr:hypothetical protein GY45DRAFT_1300919 [Cubamyces sp. BRFM 1775]